MMQEREGESKRSANYLTVRRALHCIFPQWHSMQHRRPAVLLVTSQVVGLLEIHDMIARHLTGRAL